MKQGHSAVKKRLMFCEVLEKQLVKNKQNIVSHKEKSMHSKIISGKVLKKYKSRKILYHIVNRYQQNKNSKTLQEHRVCKENTIKHLIEQFLQKDQISGICPGKRDIIMKNGKEFRKRFLQDTLTNLHQKFCKETKLKISFNTFAKYKPFWIIKSKMSARNTCLCKTHINFDLMLQKLYRLKVLSSSSSHNFISMVVCNLDSKCCMYRECKVCNKKEIPEAENGLEETFYYKWCQKTIDRKGAKGLTYNVKVTSKEAIKCNVNELVVLLNTQTPFYLKHVHDTDHQLKFVQNLKNTLKEGEVLVVVDFSENYLCKYATEIQSVHFGASKKQVSLHTGAFFSANL